MSQFLTLASLLLGLRDSFQPALAHYVPRRKFTLPGAADHRSLALWIGRLAVHRLRGRTTVRCLGAGLLSLGDPGTRLMQAMKYIDRPFMCGGRGELASEGTPVGGDDKGDRSAAIGVTAQCLREVRNVCGSEVEVCPRDLDDFGEAAYTGFSKLLRRAANLIGSKLATSNNRHQPVDW